LGAKKYGTTPAWPTPSNMSASSGDVASKTTGAVSLLRPSLAT